MIYKTSYENGILHPANSWKCDVLAFDLILLEVVTYKHLT